MRILGVDPGLQITGYGVVSLEKGDRIRLVEAGVVRTKAAEGIAKRLARVHSGLLDVITELKPSVLAIERLYAHYKHPATAILMGHVRGVICLLSATEGVRLVSLPATHVKKSVTGRGHAPKFQMQRMVQHTLGLKRLPEPADVADALAVAISCASTLKRSDRRGLEEGA